MCGLFYYKNLATLLALLCYWVLVNVGWTSHAGYKTGPPWLPLSVILALIYTDYILLL
jgi:hypothetical protein